MPLLIRPNVGPCGCIALLAAALIALGSIVPPALAVPGDMLLRLHSDDVAPYASMFGEAIAAVGDDLLIGAPLTSFEAPFSGRAYLVDGKTGELRFEVHNPAPFRDADFGAAVAAGPGVFAVGAPGSINAAYVFDADTGEMMNYLRHPDLDLAGGFGSSIAFLGDKVLVGSRADSIRDGPRQTCCRGAAYLYDGFTGQLVLPLRNPDPDTVRSFGFSIATFNGKLLVGTPRAENETGRNVGRVYVFNAATSQQLFTLENPVPQTGAGQNDFGDSLATLGNRVIVGAPDFPLAGLPIGGAAYVFDGATGDYVMALANPDPQLGDDFGHAVAAVENNILVGAPFNDVDGVRNAGSVYLFDGQAGELLLTIDNPDRRNAGFGMRLTALGNKIVVGAPFDAADETLTGFGTVYVFEGVPDIPVGDTDADGDVDIDDLNAVRNHFGQFGPDDGTLPGDTWPYDGAVGIDDLNRIRNYFGNTRGPAAPVAEPATLVLAALAAFVTLIAGRRTWNAEVVKLSGR